MEKEKQRALEQVLSSSAFERVQIVIGLVVRLSFAQDAERRKSAVIIMPGTTTVRVTRAETTRRAKIVYDWFMVMRQDCHYSSQKALDMLPRALRATLDGEDWEPPPAERSWSPGKDVINA